MAHVHTIVTEDHGGAVEFAGGVAPGADDPRVMPAGSEGVNVPRVLHQRRRQAHDIGRVENDIREFPFSFVAVVGHIRHAEGVRNRPGEAVEGDDLPAALEVSEHLLHGSVGQRRAVGEDGELVALQRAALDITVGQHGVRDAAVEERLGHQFRKAAGARVAAVGLDPADDRQILAAGLQIVQAAEGVGGFAAPDADADRIDLVPAGRLVLGAKGALAQDDVLPALGRAEPVAIPAVAAVEVDGAVAYCHRVVAVEIEGDRADAGEIEVDALIEGGPFELRVAEQARELQSLAIAMRHQLCRRGAHRSDPRGAHCRDVGIVELVNGGDLGRQTASGQRQQSKRQQNPTHDPSPPCGADKNHPSAETMVLPATKARRGGVLAAKKAQSTASLAVLCAPLPQPHRPSSFV